MKKRTKKVSKDTFFKWWLLRARFFKGTLKYGIFIVILAIISAILLYPFGVIPMYYSITLIIMSFVVLFYAFVHTSIPTKIVEKETKKSIM